MTQGTNMRQKCDYYYNMYGASLYMEVKRGGETLIFSFLT